MSSVHAVYLLSSLGAVLFFVAGLVIAPRKKRGEPASTQPESGDANLLANYHAEQRQRAQAEASLAGLQAQFNALRAERDNALGQLENGKALAVDLQRRVAQLEASPRPVPTPPLPSPELAETRRQLELERTLRTKLERDKQLAEQAAATANAQATSAAEQLQLALQAAQTRRSDDAALVENDQLRRQLDAARHEHARLNQKIQDLQRSLEGAAKQSQGELARVQAELAAAVAGIERARQDASHLRTSFDTSKQATSRLQAELDASKALTARLKADQESAKQAVSRANADSDAAKQHVSRLQSELEASKAAQERHKTEAETAKQNVARLQADQATTQQHRAQLQSALDAAAVDMARVQGELENARLQVARLESQLSAFQTKGDADKLKGEIAALRARLVDRDALAAELDAARTELEEARAAAEQAQLTSASLDKAHADGERLRNELAKAQSSLGELDTLRIEATVMRADAARAAHELSTLRDRLADGDRYRAEALKLRDELAIVQRTLTQTKDELEHLRDREPDSIVQRREQREAILRQQELAKEVVALQARLRDTVENAKAATTQVNDLDSLRSQDAKRIELLENEAKGLRLQLQGAEAKLAEYDRAREELHELREIERTVDGAERDLSNALAEAKGLRVRLQATEAKATEADRLLEENRELRAQVADFASQHEGVADLTKAAQDARQLRVENEHMARRIEEMRRDLAEVAELREKLYELTRQGEECEEIRRRMRALEAQIFALGAVPRAVDGKHSTMPPESGSTEADMQTMLRVLIRDDAARSAVLADGQGLTVAGAGDVEIHEGLSAFCGLAWELASRARGILPLGEVSSVKVSDDHQLAIECTLFQAGGEDYGVTVIATLDAMPDNTHGVAYRLKGAISRSADAFTFPEPIR